MHTAMKHVKVTSLTDRGCALVSVMLAVWIKQFHHSFMVEISGKSREVLPPCPSTLQLAAMREASGSYFVLDILESSFGKQNLNKLVMIALCRSVQGSISKLPTHQRSQEHSRIAAAVKGHTCGAHLVSDI